MDSNITLWSMNVLAAIVGIFIAIMVNGIRDAYRGSVKSFMQIFLKVLFSRVSMVINYAAILSSFDTLIAARIAHASFVILTPYHLNSLSCQ